MSHRNARLTVHGRRILVERVVSGSPVAHVVAGITHQRIRPYRPQTNGKVERLNRTLRDEWAYITAYASNRERTDALGPFLHTYNYHRCHTALGGQPPISRVNNPAGQYT